MEKINKKFINLDISIYLSTETDIFMYFLLITQR